MQGLRFGGSLLLIGRSSKNTYHPIVSVINLHMGQSHEILSPELKAIKGKILTVTKLVINESIVQPEKATILFSHTKDGELVVQGTCGDTNTLLITIDGYKITNKEDSRNTLVTIDCLTELEAQIDKILLNPFFNCVVSFPNPGQVVFTGSKTKNEEIVMYCTFLEATLKEIIGLHMKVIEIIDEGKSIPPCNATVTIEQTGSQCTVRGHCGNTHWGKITINGNKITKDQQNGRFSSFMSTELMIGDKNVLNVDFCMMNPFYNGIATFPEDNIVVFSRDSKTMIKCQY